MRPQAAAAVLTQAAAQLGGTLVRTSASVIGRRAHDSVIVATASWGYTVTVMLTHMRIAMTIRPRGWLKKCLIVEGAPAELAKQIADDHHLERLRLLSPMLVELTPMALRIEMRYGAPTEVAEALAVATSLAQRARQVEERAGDEPFAISA